VFNARRTKVTVLPFTSTSPNDPRISPAVVVVPSSAENGLSVDSLLVCVEPMTFDKVRLVQQLDQLETELRSPGEGYIAQVFWVLAIARWRFIIWEQVPWEHINERIAHGLRTAYKKPGNSGKTGFLGTGETIRAARISSSQCPRQGKILALHM